MCLTPPELLDLGVVRGILGQPRKTSSSGTPA
jgi:hypothetical protein